jgi:hypothetical protein
LDTSDVDGGVEARDARPVAARAPGGDRSVEELAALRAVADGAVRGA